MKIRHDPDKIQNKWGGDYFCPNYDTINEVEICHDEGQAGWREWIRWDKTRDGKLECKGNRHNCLKLKLKWEASLKK